MKKMDATSKKGLAANKTLQQKYSHLAEIKPFLDLKFYYQFCSLANRFTETPTLMSCTLPTTYCRCCGEEAGRLDGWWPVTTHNAKALDPKANGFAQKNVKERFRLCN